MRKLKLFVDMDEVLVNFIGGLCEAHGVSSEAVRAVPSSDGWERSTGLGHALGLNRALTLEEFWDPIYNHWRGEDEWWARLASLPWYRDFYDGLKKIDPELFLLSSPSSRLASRSGKLRWVEKFLPDHDLDRVIITRHKEMMAGPDRLLIDDREINCRRWRAVECYPAAEATRFPTGTPEEVAPKVPVILEKLRRVSLSY